MMASLYVLNFIIRRLQRSCLAVNIVKFLITSLFYRTPPATASVYPLNKIFMTFMIALESNGRSSFLQKKLHERKETNSATF